MNRRLFLSRLLQLPLVALALPAWARAAGAVAVFRPAEEQPSPIDERSNEFRFAFGSCCMQDQEQTIWSAIEKTRPDVFAFIGDNIYADTEDMGEMRGKYQQLAAEDIRFDVPLADACYEDRQKLCATVPPVCTAILTTTAQDSGTILCRVGLS